MEPKCVELKIESHIKVGMGECLFLSSLRLIAYRFPIGTHSTSSTTGGKQSTDSARGLALTIAIAIT